jgi:hypothetical protein
MIGENRSSIQTCTRAIRMCHEKYVHAIRLSTNIAFFFACNSDAAIYPKLILPEFLNVRLT